MIISKRSAVARLSKNKFVILCSFFKYKMEKMTSKLPKNPIMKVSE